MNVPFLDLHAGYLELKSEIDAAVAEVLDSGWYIGGPQVTAFEEAWAEFCGADHCVGVGNGLDALHLTLRAMDVGPGDEVIVASNSYIATLLAVSMVGATPVLVEPEPQTFNLDPARIEVALSERTKVILPTHLYGQPADLDPILTLARTNGLRVLEDAAQAHGARYKGRRIGAHGDAVTWSFYPSKNLGAVGDAGAITTNDAELARRVKTLGNYGSSQRYVNEVQGVNSRLDPIQAALLQVKLKHLDSWNQRRRDIASAYLDALPSSSLTLPFVPEWADPVWHLFVVQTAERDLLAAELARQGVQTLIHYPIPPHLQQAYADLRIPRGSYPIAEGLAETVLSLTIGPHLSKAQAERVIEAVIHWEDGASRARLLLNSR